MVLITRLCLDYLKTVHYPSIHNLMFAFEEEKKQSNKDNIYFTVHLVLQ